MRGPDRWTELPAEFSDRTEEQVAYAALDAEVLVRLWERFEKMDGHSTLLAR
jgi:hypothetical protein